MKAFWFIFIAHNLNIIAFLQQVLQKLTTNKWLAEYSGWRMTAGKSDIILTLELHR